MHDPMTLAFSIKWPFGRKTTLVDIWHVDPEKGGSDDSCGWSYVRAASELIAKARKLGQEDQVFITGKHGYAMEPLELLLEVWQTIGGQLFKRSRRRGRGISHRELVYIMNLANSPADNLRHSCSSAGTPEGMGSLFVTVLRCYLTFHRKWYQHPRWHIHHWKINIRPLMSIKRSLFTRCATCGGRFKYGESPTTNQWDSPGPKWLKSERDMHHGNCIHKAGAGVAGA